MREIRIIKILSTSKVIINAGKNQGITENDSFYIIDPRVAKLYDPFQKKVLAEKKKYKDQIFVSQIENEYSICRAKRYTNIDTSSAVGSALFGLQNTISSASVSIIGGNNEIIQEDLNVDTDDIDDFFSDYSNSRVLIGDLVEKLQNN